MKIDWDGFQESFFDFLPNATIISKDEGRVQVEMYDTQRYMFDEIFDGLRHDIHEFVVGKGRQIGITTGLYLFDTFYAGAVPDIQAGIVFDGAENKEKFRRLFIETIDTLPASHKLPIISHNRAGITFKNGNMLDYLIAGQKKGQGTLGRSRALNFAHMDEVAYYGDPDAFEAFKDVLSDRFPNRCYVAVSTGNGWNHFADLWEDALADTLSKRAIFVTWWRKRTYSYDKGTPLFRKYGWPQLSIEEREATEIVKRDYEVKISLEQWAWYRHRADPRAQAETGQTEDDSRQEVITQEHPHFPEQMFRGTGTPFMPSQYLAPAEARAAKAAFKSYSYYLGDDVTATKIEPTRFVNKAHLKVWAEPHPNGVYIVAGDPAYGISDEGDGFCAQVLRCYADRIVQVAEFCDRSIQPYQFAWVMLHLCGWYGNCRYILELNASGEAVWTEMKNLRTRLEEGGLFPRRVNGEEEDLELETSWRNMLAKVRQYLYHRQDSLGGGGYNYHMKTSLESKFTFMTQFADRFMLGQFDIFSVQALKEMRTLRKDGRSIQAEVKKKDDRPVTLGLGTRCYLDSEWRGLVSRNATFEDETAKDQLGGDDGDMSVRFMSSMMQNHLAARNKMNREAARRARRGQRWNWGVALAIIPALWSAIGA
jgi:hypothetical protein